MNELQPDDANWVVVIPAKSLAVAKSRLADLAGDRRAELALAMLLDTVGAAGAARRVRIVLVVTDDAVVSAAVSALGAAVVADAPAAGLNAALRHGISIAVSTHPSCGVALLAGDLPAVQPAELDDVLRQADVAGPPSRVLVVADRGGDGTTLLAARTPTSLRPAFGAGSFARHRELGAVPSEFAPLSGIRCDVDDAAGLRIAMELGVGSATRMALHNLGLGPQKNPGPAP
jgi:2-phospho-L-lactate/phosphoenolpyruvate guanylyltransferase